MTARPGEPGVVARWCSVWNWKSALFSALGRAPIFFAANLQSGSRAALAAFTTELVYRAVTAGFYGALTGYFARLPARRFGTLAALVTLPALAHSMEYLVHWFAGTPHITTAIVASIAVSACTTRISLFLMRRGLFVAGRQSMLADLTGLGRLIASSFTNRRPPGRRLGRGAADAVRLP